MKKFLSILLTVAMVLSMLCLPAVAAETDDDGYTLVSTFEELIALKNAGDKARLTQNIVVPTSYKTYIVDGKISAASDGKTFGFGTFKGDWDGQGFAIDFSNVEIEFTEGGAVFFTTMAGSWKNLTVKGLDITFKTAAGCQQGIIAQQTTGAYTANFENVHLKATYNGAGATGAANLGAFIGRCSGTGNTVVNINNCSVDVTANMGTANYGGFIGTINSKTTEVTISNSVSKGNIIIKDSEDVLQGNAGGFISQIQGGPKSLTISNCVNEANFKAEVVGGILARVAGAADLTEALPINFVNCVNVGTMEGRNQASGILGGGMGPSGKQKPAEGGTWTTHTGYAYKFDGCVNAGSVTSAAHRAAGIVPHAVIGTMGSLTIQNCINFGDVKNSAVQTTVEGHDTPQIFNAATILCETINGTADTVKVKNCVNFGSRSGWSYTTTGEGESKVVTATQETGALMVKCQATTENLVDMTDANNQTTSVVVDSALLRVLDGARIRLANSAANGGIRYDIASNKALLDKLDVTYDIKLGSKMSAAADVASTNYKDLASASDVSVAYTDTYLKADNTYSAAAIGITDYATEYNCGGYITLTKDAVTYTIYTEAGSARSLQYVAAAAMADDAANEDVDYSAYDELLSEYKGSYELPN